LRARAVEGKGVRGPGDVRGRVWASVGVKLAAATALIMALTAAFASYALSQHERRELFARKERATVRVAEQLALALSAPLEFDDDIAVAEALLGISDDAELVQLRVIDRDRAGVVATAGQTTDPPEFGDAVGGVVWQENALWISRPIGDDAGTQGTLVLGMSLAREHAIWKQQRDLILLGCGALAMVVAGLLLAAARKMVLVPLSRLADAAEAFGRGRTVVLPPTGGDEVGRLGHSFAAMMDAIGEREGKLAAAHAEVGGLLDAMRQAVFGFGPELVVTGRFSKAASRVFARASVEGLDVRELLLAGQIEGSPEAAATVDFLETVFEIPLEAWQDAVELAPRELCLHPGTEDERSLVLEFVPLVEHHRLGRVMVVVTDETEERRARREVQRLENRHIAEIEATRRLLGMGANVFVQFTETTATRLACVEKLLGEPTPARVGEVLRQIHSVRGDARALGLVELANHLAQAESVLADVRDGAAAGNWITTLRESLGVAEADVTNARERLIAASPLGAEVLDQATVSARDLQRLSDLRDDATPQLRACIDRVRGRMLGPLLVGLADAAGAWAAVEGKRVQLEIVGATARLGAGQAVALRTAIVQLVRNAIAHGIESPAQRAAMGKPEVGRIRISAETRDELVSVEVWDDGAGIDFAALAVRAANDGGTGDPCALPFVAGLSTRVTPDALAGRGVGLAAVREELAGCGYAIALDSTRGLGTRCLMSPHE
jgi:signal transduction histidine kinase